MIRKCTCEHKYQDEVYGKKNRIHNEMNPKEVPQKYRCTVCGNVRT